MEFTLPSTKTEMYNTLKEIFHYYRIRRENLQDVTIENINLTRMQSTVEDENVLYQMAEKLVAPSQEKEKKEYLADLNEQLIKINAKLQVLDDDYNQNVIMINELYNENIKNIEKQAQKNGMSNTSIVIEKRFRIEEEKSDKLIELKNKLNSAKTELNASKTAIQTRIEQVESYFQDRFEKEKIAKQVELIQEQKKTEREIFKYNNGLDEKEQRFQKTIEQYNFTAKLRYLEIQSKELSRDELVEAGYFTDVVDCVCGYFDRLDPFTAYQEIVEERKLIIYLEEFYDGVVYTYKLLAGV